MALRIDDRSASRMQDATPPPRPWRGHHQHHGHGADIRMYTYTTIHQTSPYRQGGVQAHKQRTRPARRTRVRPERLFFCSASAHSLRVYQYHDDDDDACLKRATDQLALWFSLCGKPFSQRNAVVSALHSACVCICYFGGPLTCFYRCLPFSMCGCPSGSHVLL